MKAALGIAVLLTAFESKPALAVNFDQQQICRAAISAVMGRDPKTLKVTKVDSGVIHLSYSRPDDETVWEQRCRVEGQKVVWATKSGRWREHTLDDVITYTVTGTSLTISQKFTDGSTVVKSYSRAELGLK
ncbi:hypothetical protein [Massilia sp. HP4]|uniref:hypothetical protein n=1 Tax=Massilia sp. HP4 TaxID=2562316 RepID=UPI0010C0D28B|nr:hypothetical protein [Massilia sp. HP4]